jgi:hypothetical protein
VPVSHQQPQHCHPLLRSSKREHGGAATILVAVFTLLFRSSTRAWVSSRNTATATAAAAAGPLRHSKNHQSEGLAVRDSLPLPEQEDKVRQRRVRATTARRARNNAVEQPRHWVGKEEVVQVRVLNIARVDDAEGTFDVAGVDRRLPYTCEEISTVTSNASGPNNVPHFQR